MIEQRSIRVLIADDHTVVREALALLLSTFPDLEMVGEASDSA
jgi:DNA-binding NarL/FixJ family response regulator